jgi:hypothetical protein
MIVALCCAALGALLSVRCTTFALIPASAFVIGLTTISGLLNEWSALALVLVTIANLIVLQVAYGIGGLVLQVIGVEPAERQALGFRHKNSKL